ncbi:hypothetical protein HC766_02780 [Candidatus Gracilibacteria bacterium]|nr:hypothetical protein [Candidatus Gracilibacteria bacterium]
MNTDPDQRIKTAMGYGCPDNSNCDSQYFGFANQLNWSAYQLEFNYKLASSSNSAEPYRKDRTITTLDGYKVFLSNEATAANYRYTPHAYWGNYNLWKILTANGWGVDTNTYSSSYIDTINLHKIETPDGVQNPTLKESEISHILSKKFEIGHSGGDVILLQRFLRQQGHFTYEYITGYYGNITKTAHTNYLNSSKPSSSPAPAPTPQPESNQPNNSTCDQLANQEYQFGQVGDTVKKLQECLQSSGHFIYPHITGYYGPITEKAQLDYLYSTKSVTSTPASTDPCESLKNKTWTFGVTSIEVIELQKCMRKDGTFTWEWDTGYFGPVTQEAFNKWKGQDAPTFSCANLQGQAWKFGETSERVRQLQACMRTAGAFTWQWDTGYFGDVTKASLIKWRGYF